MIGPKSIKNENMSLTKMRIKICQSGNILRKIFQYVLLSFNLIAGIYY